MSPNKRKPLLKSLFSAHLACSCDATRPNHPNVYQPQPKPKPKPKSTSSSSPTTLSPPTAQYEFGKPGPSWQVPPGDVLSLVGSVAVVKESKDPYEDFRHSMLQMIFENKIFSTEDLHHLLRCFLQLNSPNHHHYIVRAFFQVCDVVVSSSIPSDGV